MEVRISCLVYFSTTSLFILFASERVTGRWNRKEMVKIYNIYIYVCVKDRLRFRVNLENGEISCIINIERKETRLVRILLISGAQFPRIDSICIFAKIVDSRD